MPAVMAATVKMSVKVRANRSAHYLSTLTARAMTSREVSTALAGSVPRGVNLTVPR
jgi:hypothetical protein